VPAVSRRAALVLIVLAFCGALLVGRMRAGGSTAGAEAPASTTGASAASSAAPAATAGPLLVHVVGAVLHPGVYELAGGARARDAVTAAGGATRRAVLEGLNLAAPVADGEQVVVPVKGQPSHAAATPSKPAIVRLNQADVAALDTLPGVGPATAQRIIAWRDEHGPFGSVEDLLDVPGIGESKLGAMRELIEP
jgi:competence protein ComEA